MIIFWAILGIILLMFIGTWIAIKRLTAEVESVEWVSLNERKIIKSRIKDLGEKDIAAITKWQNKTGSVLMSLFKRLGYEVEWEQAQPERAVMVDKVLTLKSKITSYKLSKDGKGLLSYFEDGTYFHMHSKDFLDKDRAIYNSLKK